MNNRARPRVESHPVEAQGPRSAPSSRREPLAEPEPEHDGVLRRPRTEPVLRVLELIGEGDLPSRSWDQKEKHPEATDDRAPGGSH